jgi:hypothetical protein
MGQPCEFQVTGGSELRLARGDSGADLEGCAALTNGGSGEGLRARAAARVRSELGELGGAGLALASLVALRLLCNLLLLFNAEEPAWAEAILASGGAAWAGPANEGEEEEKLSLMDTTSR